MSRRGALAALHVMSGSEDQNVDGAIERFRADMEKGFGGVRIEIGSVRTEMEKGFGTLRAEMIDRDAALLKWFLVYAVTQTGVIAALLKLFR